jgi:predicted nucleic acid-binding protein
MRTPYRYAVHRSWYELLVACAVAANAEYIVTNDKHFNPLKEIPWPKVEIIKLIDFIKQL